jgi:predicted Rossmann fold nucleotide-binding protein DprA/Smf involved in DNA uptake
LKLRIIEVEGLELEAIGIAGIVNQIVNLDHPEATPEILPDPTPREHHTAPTGKAKRISGRKPKHLLASPAALAVPDHTGPVRPKLLDIISRMALTSGELIKRTAMPPQNVYQTLSALKKSGAIENRERKWFLRRKGTAK